MPSLTLKDIPKRLHQRLKERAARHRRSLSQEALACLEQMVAAEPVDAAAVAGGAFFQLLVQALRNVLEGQAWHGTILPPQWWRCP